MSTRVSLLTSFEWASCDAGPVLGVGDCRELAALRYLDYERGAEGGNRVCPRFKATPPPTADPSPDNEVYIERGLGTKSSTKKHPPS